LTLTNVDNTIQGTGQYGQNGLAITNESGGTINAMGGTLTMNGGGLVTNAGLIGAISTGTLQINNTVDNAGGNITANAGTVSVNSTINGGTLNQINGGTLTSTNATLNGVTLSTGSTYNVGDVTFLQGTITNNGTFTVPDTTLQVNGGNVTLTGGGTLTNAGTLKATNGGTLLVSTPFSSADFSGGTLQAAPMPSTARYTPQPCKLIPWATPGMKLPL
jgi:hypothetical protein